jgi:AraC family transcriptional regulator of adaptative response/methylated-DNA-[protein]-cysteine methyltransferase
MNFSIDYSIFCKNQKDQTIEYGKHDSPFGSCFLASINQNICMLAFFDSTIEEENIKKELFDEWKNTKIIENQSKIQPIIEQIFMLDFNAPCVFKLLLKGTDFQIKTWQVLLTIPPGKLMTYQEIAHLMGQPKAVRAAASAIAKNKIAYLIPCHRVIRKSGELGQYRWHAHRKQSLIAVEERLSSLL